MTTLNKVPVHEIADNKKYLIQLLTNKAGYKTLTEARFNHPKTTAMLDKLTPEEIVALTNLIESIL